MYAPFGPPSSIGGLSRDHEDGDESGQSATDLGIFPMQNIHTPDLLRSRVTNPGRRRSSTSSSSSSEDTIRGSGDVDSSHPPVISYPPNHANIKKHVKFKPYQRSQANAPSKVNTPPQADDTIIADLLFAEKFLGKHPSTNYIIDDVLEGKELFEQGMDNMPDEVIAGAILVKRVNCKAKRLCLMATFLETEATKRHVKLLYKLRVGNAQMYADNPLEAFRIESVMVRRTLDEFEDDLPSSAILYADDMGAYTAADLHLDVLEGLAAARNTSLSEECLKDGLEANLAETGNSSKPESSDD